MVWWVCSVESEGEWGSIQESHQRSFAGAGEAFQGGGALHRPISGLDRLIPAESSFLSIPSSAVRPRLPLGCGHGHGQVKPTSALAADSGHRIGNLSYPVASVVHELLLHFTFHFWDRVKRESPCP